MCTAIDGIRPHITRITRNRRYHRYDFQAMAHSISLCIHQTINEQRFRIGVTYPSLERFQMPHAVHDI